MEMPIQTVALVASVLAGFLTVSRGCSYPVGGFKLPTLEEKLKLSEYVVQGVPISTQPDPMYHDFGGVYSVNFKIQCIYKGPRLKKIIRIDEAGFIPGHCFAKDLTVGVEYVVYLTRMNGQFIQSVIGDPADEHSWMRLYTCKRPI